MNATEKFRALPEHVRKMVIRAYNLRCACCRARALGKDVVVKRFTTQHERLRAALARENIIIPEICNGKEGKPGGCFA